jgi:hypothetical protein
VSIVCDDYDLLFTHVPKTGGIFVERLLLDELGGRKVGGRHATFRWLSLPQVPKVRVFVVRQPIDWYRSYWAYVRSIARSRAAWIIWDTGRPSHPTTLLDRSCGADTFEGFITNVVRHFPNGFVRSMYCDFMNGATHALRTERLRDDLAALLQLVGYATPGVVHERPPENQSPPKWTAKTTLPIDLERRLVELDNLDGLQLPYVTP